MSHVLFRIILLVCLLSYAVALMAKGRDSKFLRRSAFTILLLGTALWYYAFSLEEYAEDGITIFLRSFRGGLKLFFADAELWEVEKAQEEPYFLDIFFSVMAAAIFTTVSAILSVFGQRLQNLLILNLRARKKAFRHVFFDPERGSKLLISSLEDEEGCVCIEYPDNEEDKFSLEGMAENIFKKHEKVRFVNKVTVLNATKSLFSLDKNTTDILSQMGLKSLKNFIDDETVFYLLSEDYDSNIASLVHLNNDPLFFGKKVFVRMGDNESAHMYEHSFKNIRVKFIYVSALGSKEIVRNKYFHPSITIGEGATEFNALVIGFGKVGQNVTKQLLSFADSAQMKDIKSTIYILDGELDRRFSEYNLAESAISDSRLRFENASPGELAFWEKISALAKDINLSLIHI